MTDQTSIYVPHSLTRYELCHPADPADFEYIVEQVSGVPRKSTWHPIAMEIIHKDNGLELLESESPWLGSHALVFRRRAVEALNPLLEEYGEFLPVCCEEADLWIFNPTTILDALNEDSSSVLRFSNEQIMRVNQYVFRPDIVRDIQIFKIPNLRASPTFVSDHFVQRWKSAGLRGLGFKKVWSA